MSIEVSGTSMRLRARAKLNLALDIAGRRADGRHNIETVMQSIGLADGVEVAVAPGYGRISVQVGAALPGLAARVPEGEGNIAYRAAARFLEELRKGGGGGGLDVQVRIHKAIPTEAGLGGGSADAGAVLVALNRLLGEAMAPDRLAAMGERIGADVPFAMYALERGTTGAAFATGVGEIIRPVPGIAGAWFVIAVPAFGLSTKDMYGLWDAMAGGRVAQERRVADGGSGGAARSAKALADVMVRGDDIERMCQLMANDFHHLAEMRRPEIGRVANALMEQGAMRALLTGSGSAVFGVFRSEEEAAAAAGSDGLNAALRESKGAGEEQEPVTIVAAATTPPQCEVSGRRLG